MTSRIYLEKNVQTGFSKVFINQNCLWQCSRDFYICVLEDKANKKLWDILPFPAPPLRMAFPPM